MNGSTMVKPIRLNTIISDCQHSLTHRLVCEELISRSRWAWIMGQCKVLVIGLDSMPPSLLFDEMLPSMPTIAKLLEKSAYGRMNSTIPCITSPAWMSMMTSRNPGRLGFYGFRNRHPGSDYGKMKIVTSNDVPYNTLWQELSDRGLRVAAIGVPQTWPVKPVNGYVVSSFLTPSIESEYTHPPELAEEIAELVGEYQLDVENFRSDEKDRILQDLYDMTRKRFTLASVWLEEQDWDYFMLVEMAPDRLHHAFWKWNDEDHPKYEADHKFNTAFEDYYRELDGQIASLLEAVDNDDLHLIILSDHGSKAMQGAININEWLVANGYMTLRETPRELTSLKKVDIDWANTIAWGEGGYHGRLYLNVKGREPEGKVDPGSFEQVRSEIAAKLREITDPDGVNIGTEVFTPQEVYDGPEEFIARSPDLIIYFGGLNWRSTGGLGYNSIWSFETEIGPDDGVHDQYGVFMHYSASRESSVQLEDVDILDVAPTVMTLLDQQPPEGYEGKSIGL